MIYCENIMDMKPVFYSSRDFETTFFFSIFDNTIITIAKKKKIYSPISTMTLLLLPFFFLILRALNCRNSTFSTSCFLVILSPLSCFLVILSPLSYFLVILSPLSWFLAEFRQRHCRNSVSLLSFPINFEQ